jgi:hypothetical protein
VGQDAVNDGRSTPPSDERLAPRMINRISPGIRVLGVRLTPSGCRRTGEFACPQKYKLQRHSTSINRSPRGGSLQTAVSYAPTAQSPSTHFHYGRIRYSTRVSGQVLIDHYAPTIRGREIFFSHGARPIQCLVFAYRHSAPGLPSSANWTIADT